jgi:hypothetical protein
VGRVVSYGEPICDSSALYTVFHRLGYFTA